MYKPAIGDEISCLSKESVRDMPRGTILEAVSETFAFVVYRVADVGWTITGQPMVVNNAYISKLPVRWIVRYVP